MDPPLIAVGSASLGDPNRTLDLGATADSQQPGSHGKLAILEYNESSRRWNLVEDVAGVRDSVFDVAFAPSLGQSYHLLAVATASEVLVLRIKAQQPQQALGKRQ